MNSLRLSNLLRLGAALLFALLSFLAFLAGPAFGASGNADPFRNAGDTLPGWRHAAGEPVPAGPGIRLGGSSESRVLRSRIAGPSVSAEAPTGENQAYSRADLAVDARPGAATGAHAEIRMHQDWSRYYEEGPNPLVLRWLDYSGSLLDGALSFSLGDFRSSLSPLTMAAPGPDFLMEPGIFAARRRRAMAEWFLEDGSVPLQGARLRYAAVRPAWLGADVEALGARLRRADPDGSAWRFTTDDADRWAGLASARFTLRRGLELGAAHLRIADPVSLGRARGGTGYVGFYETNTVTAPRAALDAAPFLRDLPVTLRLEGEYALSAYRAEKDSGADTARVLRTVQSLEGRAVQARLLAGYGDPEDRFSIRLDASFLDVDPDYVNDLAQSPAFLGRRILNSKNPVGGAAKGYSTLDALYNHAYDIRPVTSLNTLEGWGNGPQAAYEGSNNWLRSAAFKNSYASYVTTRAEREALKGGLDPHVQLLFPFGRATPNRTGLDASLSAAALGGALRATVVMARLKEKIASDTLPAAGAAPALPPAPATFARDGLGMALELERWIDRPAGLSFGWTRDSRNGFKATFLNLGASVRALDWLDLSAGWQSLAAAGTTAPGLLPGLTQTQWALGLETRLGPRTTFALEGGVLDLKEPGAAGFRQFQGGAALTLGF